MQGTRRYVDRNRAKPRHRVAVPDVRPAANARKRWDRPPRRCGLDRV